MRLTSSIKQKLRFSFATIIIIAALGSGYSFYIIEKSKNYIQYKEQISTILMDLKDARVSEKNFILFDRKTIDFLEDQHSETIQKHHESIASINNRIDSMVDAVGSQDMMLYAQLLGLQSAVKAYQNNFMSLSDLYYKRGFKDHGLEGSMRDNVHDLQKCVSPEEKVFAFSLRRHEKDFMLRKDLKYRDQLKQTAGDFQLYVAKAVGPHMTSEYKANTIKVIDDYVQKFEQLVALEIEIGLTENEGLSGKLKASAASLLPISDNLFEYADAKSSKLQSEASLILIGSILTSVLIGLIMSFGMDKLIVRPILLLNKVIQDEIEGKPKTNGALDKIKNRDEIGKLTTNFREMMHKLDTQLREISESNKALELKSEEDHQRKWVAEGVSSFVDLMKNNQKGISEISYQIISGVVNYINANQGGIFFIDDLVRPEKMELAGSYAYNRRKYMEKQIYKGEGLVGAVWEEKTTVVISDIPQDYISITSGLGHARPDKLLISPIKNDEMVFGVMEIASFNDFQKHEIEMIEKTCQRLAASFETMKIQERTNTLLQTSQMQAEELKAQEEEMRQNLEEMAATQEDYSRREKELQTRIQELEEENQKIKRLTDFHLHAQFISKKQ